RDVFRYRRPHRESGSCGFGRYQRRPSCGALGKPVWIMLPFVPDWRWLLDRQDSPWYPTARLFRQHGLGDWTDVLSRIVAELERLVREGTGDSGHAARTSRRAE